MNLNKKISLGLGLMVGAVAQSFAAIDTTTVTASLTDAGTAAAAVAAVALGVYASIKAFKMIKSAW